MSRTCSLIMFSGEDAAKRTAQKIKGKGGCCMRWYYRFIIIDGSGAEVSRDYKTRKDAEFDLPAYAKLCSGCKIKRKRYYYI